MKRVKNCTPPKIESYCQHEQEWNGAFKNAPPYHSCYLQLFRCYDHFYKTNCWQFWQFWQFLIIFDNFHIFLIILTIFKYFDNLDNFVNFDNYDNFYNIKLPLWQLQRQSWILVTFETLIKIQTIVNLAKIFHWEFFCDVYTGQLSLIRVQKRINGGLWACLVFIFLEIAQETEDSSINFPFILWLTIASLIKPYYLNLYFIRGI